MLRKVILTCIALIFVYTFTSAQSKDTIRISAAYYFTYDKIDDVCEYLTEKTGYYFKPVEYQGFEELIKGFDERKVDMAFLSPLNYVLVRKAVPAVEPLVVLGQSQEKTDTYRSCVITYPGSRIKKIKKLSSFADDVTITFVQPNSTSGHLVPRLYLASFGLDPAEDHFKKVQFSGSHRESILLVANKYAELGGCNLPEIDYAIKEGKINEGDIEILWTSNPIPGSPLIAHTGLDVNISNEVRLLLSEIHNNEKMWQHIVNEWGASEPVGFINASDEDYDAVRRIVGSLDDFENVLNRYKGSF